MTIFKKNMDEIHNALETKRNVKKYREIWQDGGRTFRNRPEKLNADSTKSTNMGRNGGGLYSSVDKINKVEEEVTSYYWEVFESVVELIEETLRIKS